MKFDLREKRQGIIRSGLLGIILALAVGAAAQDAPVKRDQPATPAPAWRLQLKNDVAGYFVTARGKDAPLKELAAELSRQLKAPVVLSRVMEKQKVTLDFEDLPLESALQIMAPLPYIHYELRGGTTPICREVFLNAYNEPVPVPKVDNKSASFVFQGNTESTTDNKDDPLRVSYSKERLSVTAKKQALIAVLDRIASEMGVNFNMKKDADDTIDLDFKDLTLEEAVALFPPEVHMHVRKDLQNASTLPLLVEFVK